MVVEEAKLKFTVESGWGNKEEVLEESKRMPQKRSRRCRQLLLDKQCSAALNKSCPADETCLDHKRLDMKFAKESKMQGVHEVEQYSRLSTIDSVHATKWRKIIRRVKKMLSRCDVDRPPRRPDDLLVCLSAENVGLAIRYPLWML